MGIDFKRATIAGVIAGTVFVMMEMLLVTTALGGPLWGPPRMMGAIVMGKEALPPPATFDFVIVMAGMVVHYILSVVYAIIIAFAAQRFSAGIAIAIGAAIGLAIYVVNFYVMTSVFPWFANARNWVTIVSHIVFGAVAAWYYVTGAGRSRSSATAVT